MMHRQSFLPASQRVGSALGKNVRHHCSRRAVLVAASALTAGTKVKVAKEVMVYHVPKVGTYNLEGAEGVVAGDVTEFKGKKLSANLPYKVNFDFEKDGARLKFFAHLAEDELEVIA